MEKSRKVKHAIKRKFPVIDINDSLGIAIKMMADENASVMVVKVEDSLVGIVTVADVMHGLANDYDLEETKISTFMTECSVDSKSTTSKPCIQLDEDQDVVSAVRVMYEGGVNHLLVSGEKNEPLGIVSSLDLVKLVAAQ